MNAKRLLIRSAILLILCVLASAVTVGAFALSHSDPLLFADLSKADFRFNYTPTANSEYALYIHSEDGGAVHARAELMENGEIIASGEGSGEIFSSWLVSGSRYSVRVHGSGRAVIEIARKALSRCSGDPLWIEEDSSNGKLIARAYDAHWYAFRAEDSGEIMLCGVPEDAGLFLRAMLFDESGALVSRFEALPGGACKLNFVTEKDRVYYVRMSAPNGSEGYYHLNLLRARGDESAPGFAAEAYDVSLSGSLDLSYRCSGSAVMWSSDDPETAFVAQDGRVYGLREGSTSIWVHGFGGSSACRVDVREVALEGIEILAEGLKMSAGDDASIELQFTPANASVRDVRFEIGDPALAQVHEHGVLQALAPGKTTLTVFSADGRFSDSVTVEIAPAAKRYRALLIGEQNYPQSVNTTRNGSENSMNAVAKLLKTMDYESAAFQTRIRSDLSRAELIYEIRDHFSRATEQDISLVYISCHGSYTGGMSFLELSDGSMLSARDLERELRRIRGTVVVMIDCCGSGGAIGRASDYADFARGITSAFAAPAISLSKYKVICSAGMDQDSFRIAFNENADSGVMATVFARALCDAAGWSIDRDNRSTMGADRNYDQKVSMGELADYMQTRVDWYLRIASSLTGSEYIQSVQVYPESDPFILFER